MAEEWIDPNYNLVDIIEYEMKLEKRRCIEDFCIKFFKNYWENDCSIDPLVHSCHLLIKEKRLIMITKSLSTYSTEENFNTSFRTMCGELFKDSIVKNEYIVSLLAFCIELDTCLQEHVWYSPTILIKVLVNALEDVQFNPLTFSWNRLDLIDTIITSFILIIPPLLFFYELFK